MHPTVLKENNNLHSSTAQKPFTAMHFCRPLIFISLFDYILHVRRLSFIRYDPGSGEGGG